MEKAEGWAYFAKDLWVLADIPDLQDEAQDRLSLNCIDYRILIEVTRKDAYPHPRVYDTLDTLAGHIGSVPLILLLDTGKWRCNQRTEDSILHPQRTLCLRLCPLDFVNRPCSKCFAHWSSSEPLSCIP